MDFQQGIVERFGTLPALNAARRAVDAAHTHGLVVIYVRVAFRPGYPEVSLANRSFATIAAGHADFTDTSPGTQLHSAFTPVPGDVMVLKRRVSAFAGSDLDVVLRAGRINTLVLAGIATSGVVLSTLREAADRDFHLVVLDDACADQDSEVHRVLIEKVFPRQARVLGVEDWIAGLDANN